MQAVDTVTDKTDNTLLRSSFTLSNSFNSRVNKTYLPSLGSVTVEEKNSAAVAFFMPA